MITVILYGTLEKFGRSQRYAIRTPAEAIRALCANKKGFRQHLLKHSQPGYRVIVGRQARDLETLQHPADDVIRIVPVIQGSGDFGKIILGAALIAVAVIQPAGWGAFALNMAGGIGASLVLGGVAGLLAPNVKQNAGEQPKNLPSFAFDGPVNTTEQGNAISLAYGRIGVGSQVISAGLFIDDISPR